MKYWKTEIPNRDYYAVIFCSTKSTDLENYKETDEKIMKLAIEQEGFLGYESAGGLDATGKIWILFRNGEIIRIIFLQKNRESINGTTVF